MSERLQGFGVSSGVGVGRIFLVHAEPLPVVADPVPPERLDAEIEAFAAARRAARDELEQLKQQVLDALGESYAGIFDAQKLVLDDPSLVDKTIHRIRVGRVSARWALKEVVAELTRRFENVDDAYIRQRGGELADVQHRLQRLLRGETPADRQLPPGPLVVVAHSVGPSDTVILAGQEVVGLATDVGGRTSHTAILAQALSLPAVVGLHDFSRRATAGDQIVLDGDNGQVIVRPGPAETATAHKRRAASIELESRMSSARDLPAVTLDGTQVTLRANIELPGEVDRALTFGAQGIGLYRSEFLFLARAPTLPTEEDHFRTYLELAEKVAPQPVVIRTLDLGGEKYFNQVLEEEEAYPVLGMRAVRFCLRRLDIFRPQLGGLLRAAALQDNLRIMLPLVTMSREIRQVREILDVECNRLEEQGHAVRRDVPLGIMIEAPAAAMAADLLAAEADFFSIGTNDLIQYALAVDRGSDSLAHLYDPLHPGVLRMLSHVIQAASQQAIPVAICGEMAADIQFVPLLVGLGLRDLSVQPRAIAAVRETIRSLTLEDARRLAAQAIEGTRNEPVRPTS